MTTGTALKETLKTVTAESMTNGTMPELWELLPDMVAGSDWVGEVVDSARTFADWLTDDRDYSLDDLQDMTGEIADSETEDYYSNINKRVQALSLWAYPDLDEEVISSGIYTGTLTDMNSAYLYCAMRGLYYVLAQWAMDTAEEVESE